MTEKGTNLIIKINIGKKLSREKKQIEHTVGKKTILLLLCVIGLWIK